MKRSDAALAKIYAQFTTVKALDTDSHHLIRLRKKLISAAHATQGLGKMAGNNASTLTHQVGIRQIQFALKSAKL